MSSRPSPPPNSLRPKLPMFWVVLVTVSAAAGATMSILTSPAVGVPFGLAVAAFLYKVMI